MKICFFARVQNREIIDRVNFYALDVRILRELGYDVVIATRFNEIPFGCDLYFIWWWGWAFQPLFKALFGKKPTLITGVFDYGLNQQKDTGQYFIYRPAWQKMIMRYALSQASANVFVSNFEFKQIPDKLYVKNPRHIPLVVDTALYSPGAKPKEQFILNIAWSGLFNAQRKCLVQIIEAFSLIKREHKRIRLIMAGKQGEYHPILIKLAQELGVQDSVDFIGVIEESKKIELMQTCSVYLQPTLFEGFGLAVAEAMACGAVVVSSPFGAIPEVVGDCGIMVNSEDPKEIAVSVIHLLDNPKLMENVGRCARKHIKENFSYETRKQALKKVISEIVKE